MVVVNLFLGCPEFSTRYHGDFLCWNTCYCYFYFLLAQFAGHYFKKYFDLTTQQVPWCSIIFAFFSVYILCVFCVMCVLYVFFLYTESQKQTIYLLVEKDHIL